MKIKLKKKPKKGKNRRPEQVVDFCLSCPARKAGSTYSQNIVPSSGDKGARIMIVGEAPGEQEDTHGRPFVGPVGMFLRETLKELGIDDDVILTNAVRCRPEANKKPSVKVIESCHAKLEADIEYYNPQAILLMGNTPLKSVLNETGITNWRGTPFFVDDRLVIPTYHPSYVRRRFSDGDNETLSDWISDIEYVASAVSDKDEISQQVVSNIDRSYLVADTEKLLSRMVRDMRAASRAGKAVAFDTEVSSLVAIDAELLCVSFSAVGYSSWVVPISHAESVWRDMPDVPLGYIETILNECGIVGHNLKFDHLQMLMRGIRIANTIGDTMILSSLIDPRRGLHGLKRLAAIYLWMGDYDAELDAYRYTHKIKSYAEIPADILFPYAALDAIATAHLYDVLYHHADLTQPMRILHDQVLRRASKALARMEEHGFPLDEYMLHRYHNVYSLAIEEAYLQMVKASPELRRMTNDARLGLNHFIDSPKKSDYTVNPNSYLQTGMWLYDYMGLEPTVITDTGNRSVSKAAIAPYLDIPAVEAYRIYKLYQGIYSKYIKTPMQGGWTGSDGRVRSSFNINGAITGRLSSSGPNMQNIPTSEKEVGTLLQWLPIKNLFQASPGRLVLQADYSGMELRTFASVAKCRPMADAFHQGVDIHALVTSNLYHVPLEDVTKELRYRGKWVNWTILFGGDEHTLNRLYGIDHKEGRELMGTYFDMFPEVKEFHRDILTSAEDLGYVESVIGRRLYVSENMTADERRTILNFPIQSPASDVLVIALVIIDAMMEELGMESRLMNTVHDSLVTDVVPDELEDVCRLQVDVMENIVDFAAIAAPDIPLDWIAVPLVVDLEVGTHYGAMQHYELPPRA